MLPRCACFLHHLFLSIHSSMFFRTSPSEIKESTPYQPTGQSSLTETKHETQSIPPNCVSESRPPHAEPRLLIKPNNRQPGLSRTIMNSQGMEETGEEGEAPNELCKWSNHFSSHRYRCLYHYYYHWHPPKHQLSRRYCLCCPYCCRQSLLPQWPSCPYEP